MTTYQVVVARRTPSGRNLGDLPCTVTATNEDEAKIKALKHAFWETKRGGKEAKFEIADVREAETTSASDAERTLLERAIEAVGDPPDGNAWHSRCHEVSLTLVRAGLFGPKARVARGWCAGVTSQHSWIAVSGDCYDRKAKIVDPTLHTYREDVVDVLWTGTLRTPGWHAPHGQGRIWDWGKPYNHGGQAIVLDRTGLGDSARHFLDLIEPLDLDGWRQLAHAPVEGWPSGEIIDAMCEQGLRPYVPIDIVGMVTDRNPNELYR